MSFDLIAAFQSKHYFISYNQVQNYIVISENHLHNELNFQYCDGEANDFPHLRKLSTSNKLGTPLTPWKFEKFALTKFSIPFHEINVLTI